MTEKYNRQTAMGIVLAIADTAREMSPPDGVSARQALDTYAEMVENIAIREFGGRDWASFVAYVRQHSRHGRLTP